MREQTAPIVVVGAGIVGVATALYLQRDGLDVTLIDRGAPGDGTSYGNAGVLASNSIVPVNAPGLWRKAPGMLRDPDGPLSLRWSYLPRLAPWLARYLRNCRPDRVEKTASALAGIVSDSLEEHQALARGTAAEAWIAPSDYVFLYTGRDAYDGDAYGWGLRKAHGYTWDELDGDALGAYDPQLGKLGTFAVRCPDHGHIKDPGRYVKDLARHFEQGSGHVLRATVDDVIIENGAVTGVVADGQRIACCKLVVTAGAWSGPLAAKLGLKVPLESERGYHLEFFAPSWMPRAPTMIASGKFVITPMDGRLRAAGLVEFGGLDAPAQQKTSEKLLRLVRRALPNLTFSTHTSWMGHRPAPADSVPLIGAAPSVSGAFVGFGHHHIGLTAGPRTGRLLAGLISGRRPNFDLAPYDPGRFS